jgi:uncharacterized protein (TIGR03118 family)
MYYKKLIVPFSATGKNSILVFTLLVLSFGCHKSNVQEKDRRNFDQVNLVANSDEYHPVTKDTTLLNAFGIAWTPNGIAWVNSVGGHVSELYSAEGAIVRHPVNIPSPTDITGGLPCGIVFSTGKGFNLPNGPSNFLFSGFDGVLSGWNGALGDNARRIKNPPHASYTGLAIGTSGGENFIYVANFGAKKIDVWDTAFSRVQMSFVDPTLPDGYSPYNIQAVGDWLYVMYAELATSGPAAGHGIAGPGKGFVSVFGTDGRFIRRFASQGTLNIPWGVTMAPGSFLDDDDLSNDGRNNNGGYGEKGLVDDNNDNNRRKHDPKDPLILVGNFGDGYINVFNVDGTFIGQLQSHHHTIFIDGLWSLSFAPSSATDIDPSRLYFTAGPDQERDGVFGYLLKK